MFFSLRKEKNEKKPRTSRSIVCAAGSGSVAAMKDGVHARGARVIRQSPPCSPISYRSALTRRAPCACGRRLPSGTYFPHGEWWPVRASRALQHLSSRGYVLLGRRLRVRDGVSVSLLVLFSSVRKARIFLLWKGEKHVLFFAERKERKEAANVPFDRLCGRQRFGGGYERRRPRSRGSRDPSIAAMFVNIAPEGAHTARALRLRARTAQSQLLSARRVVACASSASTATPFEPWVCASQQKHESPRRESR